MLFRSEMGFRTEWMNVNGGSVLLVSNDRNSQLSDRLSLYLYKCHDGEQLASRTPMHVGILDLSRFSLLSLLLRQRT